MEEPSARTRFAAIDVGSNAMRCVVAESDGHGSFQVVDSIREPVRLGTHVFLTGRIGEATLARTVAAFQLFRRLIDSHGAEHVRAVATSALREAADSTDVLERIESETGIRVRLIDGAEEAHLVRRAVADRLDLSRGRSIAIDVGGGSVEVLALMDGDIARTVSFTIGAVRLLKALQEDPGGESSGFFALLSDYVEAIRSRVETALGREPADVVAATGGSIETLAELVGKPAKGDPVRREGVLRIGIDALRKITIRLSRLSFRERVEEYGLREDRADVIVPAGVVYLKIAEVFGAKRIYVPNVGLKDGLLLDMIEDLERRGAIESRRREIRAAALGLGRRYAIDEPHARKVTELALAIFDQTRGLHGLGDEERTLLEAAGLLHDVGLYISSSRHHKHSYYVISESDIVGLSRREKNLVAIIARYHRKRHPTRKHPPFDALSSEDRERVRRLAGILRVADVLDREHSQHVEQVRVETTDGEVRLHADADGDLLLERWAAKRKFGLFEEVFGRKLEIVDGAEEEEMRGR